MKLFRTLRSHQPSYSTADNSLNLTAPKDWKELTQEQLRYVLKLLATFQERTVVKTYMLVRFTGIHVLKKNRFGWRCFVRTTWWGKRKYFYLQAWQIESLLSQMKYVDSYEDMCVRLEDIRGCHAIDIQFHNLLFVDYLNAEKYYQLYMQTQKDEYLEKLARYLYRKKNGEMPRRLRLDAAEMLGVYMWYSDVKLLFSRTFKHFFKKVDPDVDDVPDMRVVMDAQIRALTDGDITKEKVILNTSVWRALTELDAKAREAEDLLRKIGKNGN